MKKPKVLIIDVETSPMLTAAFSLYPENIGHNNIVQDWFLICAAWKELGSKKTDAVWITKSGDDYQVVKKLRDVMASADVIIGHNFTAFDRRKINARLIYHRLPPLPPIHIVDTLREIKKVSVFSSHRLDYLSKHLLGAGKMETTPGLWLKAMNADKKAVKEMVEYNKIDVVRNEQVYNVIKPYLKSHPHTGAMMGLDRNCSCPKCGSLDFVKGTTKIRYTAAGIGRVQKQCVECHSYTTFKQ